MPKMDGAKMGEADKSKMNGTDSKKEMKDNPEPMTGNQTFCP
jgi:hypothetical protein